MMDFSTHANSISDLKKAVERKKSKIVITDPKLIKKLKPVAKLKNISTSKKIALATFLTGTGVALIATEAISIAAAPATGGVSYLAGKAIQMAEIAPVAATTGISATTLTAIIVLCATFETTVIIAIIKNYDVEIDARTGHLTFKLKKN